MAADVDEVRRKVAHAADHAAVAVEDADGGHPMFVG